MRKLVCDRCGEEIDIQFQNKFDIHPEAFIRIYNDNDGYNTIDMSEKNDLEYDLCRNCTNQLVTFLKQKS